MNNIPEKTSRRQIILDGLRARVHADTAEQARAPRKAHSKVYSDRKRTGRRLHGTDELCGGMAY